MHELRQAAVDFQHKVQSEATSRELIDLAQRIRHAIHDLSFGEVNGLLSEFDNAIPDNDDAYYFRMLSRELRVVLRGWVPSG